MRVFFLIFLLFPITVFSQQTKVGIDPELPLNNMSMNQWTGKDGLISNNLTSAQQVSSKFIWLTSFNGILRFDGDEFKLFDKKTLPFLNSNGFYQSFEDSKGNILFSSQSSGIIKYAKGKFTPLLNKEESDLSVRCIQEGKDGRLWIGTNNKGVYYVEDTTLSKADLKEYNSVTVMDILVDAAGKVWFATNGKGIIILEEEEMRTISIEDGLNSNTANKLLQTKDGKIYTGTSNGVFLIDGDNSKRLKLLDGIEVNDMLIDDYENLWIGSEQGLFKLHLTTNTFDSFTEKDGLPASQISSLFFDHENSLWLSTKKAGLIKLRDGFFQNITAKERLSSNNTNIIVEHDNAYYIGCDDGLINVYRDNVVNQLNIKSSRYNVGIRDINFGNEGEMLIASYMGLLVLKDGRERLIDLRAYGLSNDIRRILRDRDNNIWLATRSSGIVKLKNLEYERHYNSSNGLKSNYILTLEEGKDGEIFFGTHSGGMGIIDKNGKVSNYPIEGGKAGILIFNIDIQKDNNVWIATNIGIYKFENQEFKKIVLEENIGAETVFDIVVENDRAWLSSNIGLLMVSMNDLSSYIIGEIAQVPARLFDRSDGMGSQECTGATRMTLSKDGKLWIPTLGGVAVLNPWEISKNEQLPEVYITELVADFKNLDIHSDSRLSIDPGVLRYDFHFTSLSFIAPPKVRFKYKLSGVDDDWIEAGQEREAVYTNLPKGRYSFVVIGSNNDGIWNETGARIDFQVLPFFYETTTFYILLVILLGLIIYAIIQWRIHNISRVNTELLKLNEELDRFVYSASHDLRAPLSSVMGLVGVAKLETTVKGKDECLSMINDSIHKLDGFIDDIIDYSRNKRIDVKAENVDIEREIKEIYEELKYLDKDEAIEKRCNCNGVSNLVTDARRVNIILKNLISNAIRYHDYKKPNQFIDVGVEINGQSATFTIKDNGIGIKEEHLKSIFMMFYRADEGSKGSGLGLYIVKETIEKLKGTIDVQSKEQEGSTFTFTIPVLKAT